MRARLAIASAGIVVTLREIELRNKPADMLSVSPKGTVPVLVLGNGQIIDESVDIMLWALEINDVNAWLSTWKNPAAQALLKRNDGEFKQALDRYKYADRYPEQPMTYYRQQGEIFLTELEQRLQISSYLFSEHFSLIDAAIAPFVRQFSAVDASWFNTSSYPLIRQWLQSFLASPLFKYIMQVQPIWTDEAEPVLFGVPRQIPTTQVFTR